VKPSIAFPKTKEKKFPIILAMLAITFLAGNGFAAGEPIVENVTIESTSGDFGTSDNLTMTYDTYSPVGRDVKAIDTWYLNGDPFMLLNMPFEGGSTSAWTEDYSGNNNHGTVTDATWASDSGHDGWGSYHFNNDGDIDFPMTFSGNAITMSAWIYHDELGNNIQRYITLENENMAMRYDWGFLHMWVKFDDGSNIGFYSDMDVISSGEWHHVAGVWDGRNLVLYLDGVELERDATPRKTFAGVDGTCTIGANIADNENMRGNIDDVQIYTRALSGEQISALANDDTNIIVSEETQMGDEFQGEVTPNDGENDGTSETSDPVDVTLPCGEITSDVTLASAMNCNPGETITFAEDGITFDCDHENVAGPGSGVGFDLTGANSITIRNCNIYSFDDAIKMGDSEGSIVTGTEMHDSAIGLEITEAPDSDITDPVLYENEEDIAVSNSGASSFSFTVNDALIRNNAGSTSGQNMLDISDNVNPGSAYRVDWVGAPGSLPSGMYSFSNGKFVDITTTSGTVSIDEIVFKWTEDEASGIDESSIQLWRLSGGEWLLLNGTPDTINNEITISNLEPASDYGLLHSGQATPTSSGEISLYGANVTNHSHLDRFDGLSAGNSTTEGGNITEVNLSGDFLTDRWAAFFGNISGDIILGDNDSDSLVYSWTYNSASDVGTICASTYDSFTTFDARGALGSEIDSAWGFVSSATDSGTNTFNESDCIMGVGSTFISNASYADTGPAGEFITCALRTNNTGSVTKNDFFFCSNATASTNYRNDPADFEIMVPTDNAVGATETYYFYANFN
jgi:hypothetical protein